MSDERIRTLERRWQQDQTENPPEELAVAYRRSGNSERLAELREPLTARLNENERRCESIVRDDRMGWQIVNQMGCGPIMPAVSIGTVVAGNKLWEMYQAGEHIDLGEVGGAAFLFLVTGIYLFNVAGYAYCSIQSRREKSRVKREMRTLTKKIKEFYPSKQ